MKKPNILFLLSDEHSFRYMGHVEDRQGGEPVHTPNLDRLAGSGVRFSDAYCQMPLCSPSRLSLLTGLEIRRCGGWWNDVILRPELNTLPGTLGNAGYETCLVGKMHLAGTNQFAGFKHRPYGDLTGRTGHQWEPLKAKKTGPYAMRFRTEKAGLTEIPESQMQEHLVAEEGLAFVREHRHRNPNRPWFLCLSFSRPHFPLTAPCRHFERYWPNGVTPPRVGPTGDAYAHPMSVGMRAGFKAGEISTAEMMKARAAYFACVSYLDEVLGDLLIRLEAAGALDNTIIIYTSDHGEMAGEHGVWWKQGWYEACTRIPLIFSLPQHRQGTLPSRVRQTPVALLDLFPTVCSLAGVEYPDDLDGVDLSAAIAADTSPPDRPVVCDNLMPRWGSGTEFRMVRQGSFKYVRFRDAPALMFDLANDPMEQVDLCRNTPKPAHASRDRLRRFAEESMDFDEAQRERLERDTELARHYALSVPESTGNLYLMPSGSLLNAEDMLYHPTVICENAEDVLLHLTSSAGKTGG
jgi:choline-sulfatase